MKLELLAWIFLSSRKIPRSRITEPYGQCIFNFLKYMFKLHHLHPSGTYVSSSYLSTPYIIIIMPELDSKDWKFEELFSFSFWPSVCLCLEAALQKFKINLLIDFKHFPFVPTWRGFCFLSRRDRVKQTVLLPYFYFLYRHNDSSIGIGLKHGCAVKLPGEA